MSDDLSVLAPEETVLDFGGRRQVILPMTGREVPVVTRLLRPVWGSVVKGDGLLGNVGALLQASVSRDKDAIDAAAEADAEGLLQFADVVFELLGEHGEALIRAVAAAARLDYEHVADQPIDHIIRLGFAVWKVNADFFLKRVLPLLGEKARAVSGDGRTATPSSSAPATAAPMSSGTPSTS